MEWTPITAAPGTCWINDQATIEAYEPEGVYVSLGNLTDLLARADQAMFSVKEGGKDSICGISRDEGDPWVNNSR